MLRYVMRPLSAVLALAYGLSFLAVCLGGCLSAAPAKHACCQSEDGLRAPGPDKDCCTVLPGLSGKSFTPGAVAAASATDLAPRVSLITTAPHTVPVPIGAGPPLVLRI